MGSLEETEIMNRLWPKKTEKSMHTTITQATIFDGAVQSSIFTMGLRTLYQSLDTDYRTAAAKHYLYRKGPSPGREKNIIMFLCVGFPYF